MPTHSDPTCIFCKIIAGQIPCWKIFEDENVLAFLDIGPLVTGHTLVIPKSHVATLLESPPEILSAITARLPTIAQAVLAATGTQACNILVNNGPEAQQSIPHLHFHILPRKPSESFHIPWNAKTLDKSTAPTLVAAIKQKLPPKPKIPQFPDPPRSPPDLPQKPPKKANPTPIPPSFMHHYLIANPSLNAKLGEIPRHLGGSGGVCLI